MTQGPNEGLTQATFEQGNASIVTDPLGMVAIANAKGRKFLDRIGLEIGQSLCSTLCPALLGIAGGKRCLDCPAITDQPKSNELIIGGDIFQVNSSPIIEPSKQKPTYVNHTVFDITEQAREKRKKELLKEALSVFNRSRSSREVLVRILETAEKFAPYKIASILELDGAYGQTNTVLIQRKSSLKGSYGKKHSPIITARELNIAKSPLIKQIIAEGKSIIFNSDEHPDYLTNLPGTKNMHWRLVTPIISEGKVIAIFILDSDKKDSPFTEKCTADLQPFSLIAGDALRRERENENNAFTDKLTGLYNRTYMSDRLDQEIQKVRRQKIPLAVIMADIDHFKRFNDTHGHLAGDEVLRKLGEFIKRTLRRSDIACRFGGEELLFIFPKTTTDEVKKIALKLQKKLISLTINYQGDTTLPPITLSMGIVTFSENMKNQDDLLKVADKALYSAKHHGRNQIRIFEKGRFMKV
ncbi:MAG: Phytochrome-like protein cph2 [Candidatus Gottesmanbacteria bacterium GW2011_GWA2_44_17]|uniref:Phytochrome-like protein cph2 n=1 Tax=Candidatus Gottesmanbacteria bacterium GW2011_GWA2_44_17 TaxID=1618444 RepID=A0A0G1HLF2_9BACT|nr:MAG: Phytochrome-like protein cph2 [Candidatus Gottesmanbacteria bacterium GW2011_GWA2_44_17]